MSKKVLQCGICFDSLELKQIDSSTELDCGHLYHDKCVKEWCIACIDKDNEPNCPLCRKDIPIEYLEILGINRNTNEQIQSMVNTISLFQYIIKNKLYTDVGKFHKIMKNYPDEFENIYLMLEGYCMLNSLENVLTSIDIE
jgi:hypothetical protein